MASDKEGGECCPHPLCTQIVCQGKLLPWDAGTQRAGQASRNHKIRLKALLPGGNTWPEWGRRSPVYFHGSKCPGSGPWLRDAGICYVIPHVSSSSSCPSCGSPAQSVAHEPVHPASQYSQSVLKAVGGAPELLHSQLCSPVLHLGPIKELETIIFRGE